MTPDTALKLLSVKDWPPKVDVQWPRRVNRKQGEEWPVGMLLQGIIEARFALKHSPNTPGGKANQPYLAMYLRRLKMVDGNREWGPDGARVLFHGMHTVAEEDLPPMQPLPGLMLTAVFRGYEGPNDFVNIKFLVTTYGGPILPWMDEALRAQIDPHAQPPAQETRQAGGRPTQAPPSPAPEGEATPSASPSGSNAAPDLRRITTVAKAQEYVLAQSPEWQATFQRLAAEATDTGEANGWSKLQGYHQIISRAHALRAKTNKAA